MTGAHRFGSFLVIGHKIASNVDWITLSSIQFSQDFGFIIREFSGYVGEAGLKLRVCFLLGKGLGPVKGEVEVAAAVIEFMDLA